MELLIKEQNLKTFEEGKSNSKGGRTPRSIVNDEELMTFLFANVLKDNFSNENLRRVIHDDFDHNVDNSKMMLEALPMSPRRGTQGNSESNTNLDLVLGDFEKRPGTSGGIKLNDKKDSWVCFIEAKYYSDIAAKTENDPFRNQMIRVIENLATFQSNGKYADNIYFTLLIPRAFHKNIYSRFYGYKFREYSTDLSKMIEDLNNSKVPIRTGERDWTYPNDIEHRLAKVKFNICTYEEILVQLFNTGDFGDEQFDITNKDHLEKLVSKVKDAKYDLYVIQGEEQNYEPYKKNNIEIKIKDLK